MRQPHLDLGVALEVEPQLKVDRHQPCRRGATLTGMANSTPQLQQPGEGATVHYVCRCILHTLLGAAHKRILRRRRAAVMSRAEERADRIVAEEEDFPGGRQHRERRVQLLLEDFEIAGGRLGIVL